MAQEQAHNNLEVSNQEVSSLEVSSLEGNPQQDQVLINQVVQEEVDQVQIQVQGPLTVQEQVQGLVAQVEAHLQEQVVLVGGGSRMPMVAQLVARHGRLDAVFANAGIDSPHGGRKTEGAGDDHAVLEIGERQGGRGKRQVRHPFAPLNAKTVADRANITLDPTERHGFEYQSWFGFTIFAKGYSAAIGRGGTYFIDRADGPPEAATGFSLYPDPLVDMAEETATHRLFIPLGTSPAEAAKMRADGWITIAALDSNDSAAHLGCTHIWVDGKPVTV